MNRFLLKISILILFFFSLTAAAKNRINFHPEKNISAEITTIEGEILISIKNDFGIFLQKIVYEDSRRKSSIYVDDYNFDGLKDFSVSHLDEGQGVFEINRVFLYLPKEKSFSEAFPACGDEFVNLKVDKKNKTLLSTYFSQNEPKRCRTRLLPK
jgi:hypothetical protein